MKWNDAEKDDEKKADDSVNAAHHSIGDGNEDSVKIENVGKSNGMWFAVHFMS